jgi:hypothetical protein
MADSIKSSPTMFDELFDGPTLPARPREDASIRPRDSETL